MLSIAKSTTYSSVEHLARSIYLGRDWRDLSMAMFTANFDASGSAHDTRPGASFVVAGFVSTVEKWAAFESEWRALLDEYDIKPPFHMTDFEAGAGQYKAWKGDRSRRDAFLLRAVDIIHKRTHKPFSFGVVIADLRRMFREYEVPADQLDEPYPFCAIEVVRFTLLWAANRRKAKTANPNDGLEFVFELGDLHKGKFMQAAEEEYNVVPIFKKKKDWTPFQACDLLAWEHRRRLMHFAATGGAFSRESYTALEQRLSGDALRFDAWPNLEAACKASRFAKRA